MIQTQTYIKPIFNNIKIVVLYFRLIKVVFNNPLKPIR